MLSVIVAVGTAADQGAEPSVSVRPAPADRAPVDGTEFRVEAERFADVRILRYRVPGFEALDTRTKELIYYLYEAALCGRDIIYDQKYRYNLAVRRTLEQIVRHYRDDRDTAEFRALTLYLKRVWFANGMHHHYAHDKLEPGFTPAAFAAFVRQTPAEFPVRAGQSLNEFIAELTPVLFDTEVDAKLVSKSADRDVLTSSAVNFYSGLTQPEVQAFYAQRRRRRRCDAGVARAELAARQGRRQARGRRADAWAADTREAIERMVEWLEKAAAKAENDAQRTALTSWSRFIAAAA